MLNFRTISIGLVLLVAALATGCASTSQHLQADIPEHVQASLRDLRSRDAYKRGNAASRLGELKAAESAPALAKMLGDDKQYFAGYDMNYHALYSNPASLASSALVKIGAASVDPLIRALRDRRSGVRQRAAFALGQIKDPRAIEALARALRDSDADVRVITLTWLRQTDDRLLTELIRILERDRDDSVRWAAIKEIQSYTDNPRAIPTIISALNDKSPDVSGYAMSALGRVRNPQAVTEMIRVLDDPAQGGSMRSYAALGLGKLSDEASFAALLRAVDAPGVNPRTAAMKSLGMRRDARAVPKLIHALSDESFIIRAEAAGALGSIGDARALESLRLLLTDFQYHTRDMAEKAIAEIQAQQSAQH